MADPDAHVTRGCACGCDDDDYQFVFPTAPAKYPHYTPAPVKLLTMEKIGSLFGRQGRGTNPGDGSAYKGPGNGAGGGDPVFGYRYYTTLTDAYFGGDTGAIPFRPSVRLGPGGWKDQFSGSPGNFSEQTASSLVPADWSQLPTLGGWQLNDIAAAYGTAKWIVYTREIRYTRFSNLASNLRIYSTQRDWYLKIE